MSKPSEMPDQTGFLVTSRVLVRVSASDVSKWITRFWTHPVCF